MNIDLFLCKIRRNKEAVTEKYPGRTTEMKVVTVEREVTAIRQPAVDIDVIIRTLFQAVCIQVNEDAVYLLGLGWQIKSDGRQEYKFFQQLIFSKIQALSESLPLRHS